MKLVNEFREFAIKGNVVDMAVGIIIGAAFGKIVSSLVDDVVTPPLGLLIGGVDFSQLSVTLKAAEGDIQAITVNYGAFLQTVFNFFIVALAIFILVKAMNSLRREVESPAPAPAAPAQDIVLLGEIRDLLSRQLEKKS